MHASSLSITRPAAARLGARSRAPASVRAAAPLGGNNALPSLQRIERLDTATLHKYHDLDLAENELNTYCSTLPPEGQPERCWQAYSFLERKRDAAAAQEACEAAPGGGGTCADLEHLNTMAHELLMTGSMDDLVATFSTLARVEEMRAARSAAQAEEEEDVMERVFNTEEEEYLHSLFCSMDANGDGRLSMAEFRQSMAMLGDELDGSTVALIGDAMELEGFITEEQFRDIVEAEAINSKSEVAQLWRHHHLNPSKRRPVAVPRLSW
ncbi:Glycerol-3-phosphate dehydrogenase [Chlorella sorokiniana]|uniref:Glycerol-3-phosphate dehydrogenase n=1 Tax=Chlorella sorokiniana TaxID=3076 RepID=A0A2P6U421_CHLSO|nr:Glycerol-3-phosphate dehydrogenase [Chlorella sorokiniana]|eukprot:PRW61064.1 Glycerol-3-phosphate dehydrogenase [Chlorella sorokiniana]